MDSRLKKVALGRSQDRAEEIALEYAHNVMGHKELEVTESRRDPNNAAAYSVRLNDENEFKNKSLGLIVNFDNGDGREAVTDEFSLETGQTLMNI